LRCCRKTERRRRKELKRVLVASIVIAALLAGCGGSQPTGDNADIEDTIEGYVTTFNAGDFTQCLAYFTGYGDEEEARAFLSFMRNLSGELELRKVKDIAIVPPAVPGGSPTATATVVFTVAGEEGTDQMQLRKVDGQWKIVWVEETHTTYRLTHSAADAEYILNWDLIVSRCPDIGGYDRIEAFAYRGESVEVSPTENLTLGQDSPAAWASTRLVRSEWAGASFRSFAVQMMFSETAEDLDDLVQMLGMPVEQEGEYVTAALESETPMQSIQLLLAGNHFAVLIGEFASSDESLFFDKEGLEELLSIARSNISMADVAPLPPGIPEREL
jgi:hypothetical protein